MADCCDVFQARLLSGLRDQDATDSPGCCEDTQ